MTVSEAKNVSNETGRYRQWLITNWMNIVDCWYRVGQRAVEEAKGTPVTVPYKPGEKPVELRNKPNKPIEFTETQRAEIVQDAILKNRS